jgi:hypothetical protein
MNNQADLRQQMWDLIYGLLSAEEAAALHALIKSDPKAARLYAEVRLQADLVAQAARVEDASISLPQVEPRKAQPAGGRAKEHVAPARLGRASTYRSVNWLAGLAAAALAVLLAVGLCWPYLNPIAEPQVALVTAHLPESAPAGVPQTVEIETLDPTSAKGKPAMLKMRVIRPQGESFEQVVATDAAGKAKAVVPGEVVEPGTQIELYAATAPRPPRERAAGQGRSDPSPDQMPDSPPSEGNGRLSEGLQQEPPLLAFSLPVEDAPVSTHIRLDKDWYEAGEAVEFRAAQVASTARQRQLLSQARFYLVGPHETLSLPAVETRQHDQSGVVTGKFQLPQSAPPGLYAIEVEQPSGAKEVEKVVVVGREESRLASDTLEARGTGDELDRQLAKNQVETLRQRVAEPRDMRRSVLPKTAVEDKKVKGQEEGESAVRSGAPKARGAFGGALPAAGAPPPPAPPPAAAPLAVGDVPGGAAPPAPRSIEPALPKQSQERELRLMLETALAAVETTLGKKVDDPQSAVYVADFHGQYAPGEKVRLVLQVTDDAGRPVPNATLGLKLAALANGKVLEELSRKLADSGAYFRAEARNAAGHNRLPAELGVGKAAGGLAPSRRLETELGAPPKTASLPGKSPDEPVPPAAAVEAAPAPAGVEPVEGEVALRDAEADGAAIAAVKKLTISNESQVRADVERLREVSAIQRADFQAFLGRALLVGAVLTLALLLGIIWLNQSVRASLWAPTLTVAAISIVVGLIWVSQRWQAAKHVAAKGAPNAYRLSKEESTFAENAGGVDQHTDALSGSEAHMAEDESQAASAPAAARGVDAGGGSGGAVPGPSGGAGRFGAGLAPSPSPSGPQAKGMPLSQDKVPAIEALPARAGAGRTNRQDGADDGMPAAPGQANLAAPKDATRTESVAEEKSKSAKGSALTDQVQPEVPEKGTQRLRGERADNGAQLKEVEEKSQALSGQRALPRQPRPVLWEPLLTADENGQAVIEFEMPREEGDYRLVIDGHGRGRIGTLEALLRCEAPRPAAAAPAGETKPNP